MHTHTHIHTYIRTHTHTYTHTHTHTYTRAHTHTHTHTHTPLTPVLMVLQDRYSTTGSGVLALLAVVVVTGATVC